MGKHEPSRLPLEGGPFDGYVLEFDDPFPLRLEFVLPVGPSIARFVPDTAEPEGVKKLPVLLRRAVYVHFHGAGGKRCFRWKNG